MDWVLLADKLAKARNWTNFIPKLVRTTFNIPVDYYDGLFIVRYLEEYWLQHMTMPMSDQTQSKIIKIVLTKITETS